MYDKIAAQRRRRGSDTRTCCDCGQRVPSRFRRCDVCAQIQRKKVVDRCFLKQRYGVTPEQREATIRAQGGLCALCRRRPATETDHDHLTGRVRGWLCIQCNHALGKLGDDGAGVRAALEYLAPHGGVVLEGL